MAAGWVALVKKVRKRSKYSGRKYERYKKGYWKRYKRQRKQRFQRTISNLKFRLDRKPDPYPVRQAGTRGRPPMPPKAVLIALMVKVLLDLSYIDTESFLRWVSNNGLIMVVPAASTMQEHASDIPEEYLHGLLMEAASALNKGGLTLILDATGLSTEQYGRWRSVRHCSRKIKRKYVKIHLSVDLKTKTILVGMASKGWKGDNRFGLRMMDRMKRMMRVFGMEIERALTDSGYLSRKMATRVEDLGGEPFIKIRKNTTAKAGGHSAWKHMVRRQLENPAEFKAVHCYRVVIEGIISALKRLFGHTVASRKRHNQNVEALCRLILWNYGRVDLA